MEELGWVLCWVVVMGFWVVGGFVLVVSVTLSTPKGFWEYGRERMGISHWRRKGFWIQFGDKRKTFGGAKMRCGLKSCTVLGRGRIHGK